LAGVGRQPISAVKRPPLPRGRAAGRLPGRAAWYVRALVAVTAALSNGPTRLAPGCCVTLLAAGRG